MTPTLAADDSDNTTPPSSSSWLQENRPWLVVAAGLGVVLLTGVRAAWFFTIDDAYLTFRYTANLAAGHGPVWNVGEDPVEGFTNFLWMVCTSRSPGSA